MKKTPKIKVVLTRHYKGLGRAYDIVEVRAGYARNYLVPNKIALWGDKSFLDRVKEHRESIISYQFDHEQNYEQLVARLDQKTIILTRLADAKGKLYKPIRAKEVVEAIQTQLDVIAEAHWFSNLKLTNINLQEPTKIHGLITENHKFTLLINIKQESN